MTQAQTAHDDTIRHDATLKSLTLSTGELVPSFTPQRPSMEAHVPYGVDAIQIIAEPNDPAAIIRLDGAVMAAANLLPPRPLLPGRNTFRLEVTATDGATRQAYEVKVIRAFPSPNWVKVLDAAPWSPRDSAGELVFDGRMWVLGGYTPDLVSDVWCSSDGRSWRRTSEALTAASKDGASGVSGGGATSGGSGGSGGGGGVPGGINIPVNFVHDGRMWVADQQGRLFASRDGVAWELVNASPPWAGRYAAGGTTFGGRMWVMGGRGHGRLWNDVWSSVDGIAWVRELEAAPWSPRQLFSNVVAHNGRIFVIGGGVTNYQPFKAYTDVWSSADGRHWLKATDAAPWPGRIWSTCIVYAGRIWLLDGFRSQPRWRNLNEVWYSADGQTWKRLTTPDVWSERHELSACVHDGKLWVLGGNAWPLVNDVWQLHIPGLTFLSQPVVEEYAGLEYRYAAEADFNRSCGEVRYRLLTAPTWLTIDAQTGIIRGMTHAEASEHAIVVEAFDDAGETARQSYTLHVIPA